MANVARVVVEGWAPFDIAQHDEARGWLGVMNTPSYGLRIAYGGEAYGPVNEHGGRRSYTHFSVAGEEAIWDSSVKALVEAFVQAGCVIEDARHMDMEYDPDHMEWGAIEFEQPKPPALTLGSLIGLILSERGED